MKIWCLLLILCSCSSSARFKRDKAEIESSPVIVMFKSVADMNDSYFVLRENNYFEFYRQLFDSVKNTQYPGKYERNGDTLILHFYNKKGAVLLGSKAFINNGGGEIIFFNKKPLKKSDLTL